MTIASIVRVSVYKIDCHKWTVQLDVNIRESLKHVEACKTNMVNNIASSFHGLQCMVAKVSSVLYVVCFKKVATSSVVSVCVGWPQPPESDILWSVKFCVRLSAMSFLLFLHLLLLHQLIFLLSCVSTWPMNSRCKVYE
jgi:hypothetical protein